MATAYDDRPFKLGETENGVNADSNPVLRNWLGRRCRHDDVDYSVSGLTSGRSPLSAYDLVSIVLRNDSGITLLPKQLVQVSLAGGRVAVKDVKGYGNAAQALGLVFVDPWLNGTTGVPNGYLFHGIVQGVMLVKTPMAGAAFDGDIAIGDPLVCATTSTTTTSGAGRVAKMAAGDEHDVLARALSAATTAQTNTEILAIVNCPWFS